MSSESRDRADEETIAELKARVEELESKVEAPSVSRRSLLAAGGGGLAALLFGSATASAADTSGQSGTFGTGNEDFNVQDVDSTTVDVSDILELGDNAADPSQNGQLAMNGSTVKVQTDGSVKSLSNIGSGGGSGDFESGDGNTHTISIQSSAPSSPSADDLWVDTN